jgi:hypothetical protein
LRASARRLIAPKGELKKQIQENGLPPPVTRSFTGHKLEQGRTLEANARVDRAETEGRAAKGAFLFW